jgi:hypothetical protein
MDAYAHRTDPLVVSYGAGVDSTAMLVEFVRRGIRPDYMLIADTGGAKPKTLAFLPLMGAYLNATGFPPITTVRYEPRDFTHWPPYHTLEENCFTNGTLPSLAFGFRSCSQKWKIVPQRRYLQQQALVQAHWRRGGRVIQSIGFDAGPPDLRRFAHRGRTTDHCCHYWFSLIEWAGAPFCQPFIPLNTLNRQQRKSAFDWTAPVLADLARYCNRHLWHSVSLRDYTNRKREPPLFAALLPPHTDACDPRTPGKTSVPDAMVQEAAHRTDGDDYCPPQ